MNYVEINYSSKGKLDRAKIEEHSETLLTLFNTYFSELNEGEQQFDRMKKIIEFNYNFDYDIEKTVFSELLLDAINRINFAVGQYTKLTKENIEKFLETLGNIGGNSELLINMLEIKIEQNNNFKLEIKELVNQYSSFLNKHIKLNLVLKIDDSICENNVNQANSFLLELLNDAKAKSGGCYIATMAYGDYDHPQVLILRKFRDEKLSKSAFGNWFIKTYYRYSPLLVEKLKDVYWINRFVRTILNLIIKIIK